MRPPIANHYQNIQAATLRLRSISRLRTMVALSPENDILERQWRAIEGGLNASSARLTGSLKEGLRQALADEPFNTAYNVNALIASKEMEGAKAFAFFDTYLDVLSQRHLPGLGRMLAGCDALAWDALHRDHPALTMVEPPLVYCDRGIGASTIRKGVVMPDRSANPLPLIQIPYSRLLEKYNLTSILHEVGHETMVRLGLKKQFPVLVRQALRQAGAAEEVQNLYSLWMSEIGPDFWGFCASGIAAAGGIREVLAFPPALTFRVSWADPHPPAYLRALLHFAWCREMWGSGIWNDWEKVWRVCYPLSDAPETALPVIRAAEKYLPVLSKLLIHVRLPVLGNRPLTSLFDLAALHPANLKSKVRDLTFGKINLHGLSPAAHLAVFRLLKERQTLSLHDLDVLMTEWLTRLGKGRKQET